MKTKDNLDQLLDEYKARGGTIKKLAIDTKPVLLPMGIGYKKWRLKKGKNNQ